MSGLLAGDERGGLKRVSNEEVFGCLSKCVASVVEGGSK